jgi:hypothetical protein
MRENIDTIYIRDEIIQCDNIEDLKEIIFPLIRSQQEEWEDKFNQIIAESGQTKTEFAKRCGTSRVTIDKWCKGAIPKNRETFLRIGMAAGYDEANMNKLLMRYGRYPGLYAKSLEDCVCLYVMEHGSDDALLEQYQYILKKIRENITGSSGQAAQGEMETKIFREKLSDVTSESELEQFIHENSSVFQNAYHKLYAYIKMNIESNYYMVSEETRQNIHDMAVIQGWSSSLRQCVSNIRQGKWYPTRNKIISLGLHLGMDHDQVNEMLELAHMEPLCAKNIFESTIMFILENASVIGYLDMDQADYNPDGLCEYAREVMSELDLPEIEDFLSELPEVDDEGFTK